VGVAAWDWYHANDIRDDCDPQEVKAGEERYDAVVQTGFDQTHPFVDDGFGRYFPQQSDALLFYRDLPGADEPTIAAIDARIAQLLAGSATYGFDPDADLYRAFMPDEQYHWGSNRVKANIGTANLTVDGVPDGYERALGHLQYFHGVNPLATVYLSNMEELGAERSIQFLFHYWFGDNTAFDIDSGSEIGVAPGYVVGGPNRSYSGGATPPAGQPPMKSYRDMARSGSEPVWEITEPAIYYQAAYVRLLSEVMGSRP
jgi:endoglucanase